jgi:predicted unusual protein kinase regulating ubiquinone biosynthesis (AarF/ABC1/UbiB family)
MKNVSPIPLANSTQLYQPIAHPGNLCVDDNGNLVFYDFGMMDELKPNVREGFRKFCTALFAGGPTIDDNSLAKNAKQLVDGVEQAGVLAKGSDRLAVEKLARYFMRAFKDNQLGKKSGNIKKTLGTDLQTLTENDSFRFPSTFTFIFRAFASIGKYRVERVPVAPVPFNYWVSNTHLPISL